MKLFRQIEITTSEPEVVGSEHSFSHFWYSYMMINGDHHADINWSIKKVGLMQSLENINSLNSHVEAIPNTARVVEEYDKIKQDIVIPQEMKALFEALESLSNKLA